MGWSQHVVRHLSFSGTVVRLTTIYSVLFINCSTMRELSSPAAPTRQHFLIGLPLSPQKKKSGAAAAPCSTTTPLMLMWKRTEMWPRLPARHALWIKPWKTACLPASRRRPLSLPLVWAWELLGRVAMALEGVPDQSLATSPTAVSSVRTLLRRPRRKSCSTLVVDLTTKAEKVMRPPQTRSMRRRV